MRTGSRSRENRKFRTEAGAPSSQCGTPHRMAAVEVCGGSTASVTSVSSARDAPPGGDRRARVRLAVNGRGGWRRNRREPPRRGVSAPSNRLTFPGSAGGAVLCLQVQHLRQQSTRQAGRHPGRGACGWKGRAQRRVGAGSPTPLLPHLPTLPTPHSSCFSECVL